MSGWAFSRGVGFVLLLAFVALCPQASRSESREPVCQNGVGSFTATASSGVSVYVGPRKVHGFASRDCESILSWQGQQLIAIPRAWRLDVDGMDIDLGLGVLVLALEFKTAETDRSTTYRIYSLTMPVRLLREITGGGSFSAADTDLDGHVEIWASDAAAIAGLEDIPLDAFDSPPTAVLRFEKRRLVDVSVEFQNDFDGQIAKLRSQIDPKLSIAFKSGDNESSPGSSENSHQLALTKIRVVEIVLAYLYSGREAEAWRTLGGLWPTADYGRIKAVLAAAHARGLVRQVDAVESSAPRKRRKHTTGIFDAPAALVKTDDMPNPFLLDPLRKVPGWGSTESEAPHLRFADSAPKIIFLSLKAVDTGTNTPLQKEVPVHLVVDEAGKVRSIQFDGAANQRVKSSSETWRFIPAFKLGRPVACSFEMVVSSPE